MARIRRLPLLFGTVLVPCVALGALGVRSLLAEASTAERRFREQAEGALDTAAAGISAVAAGLPGGVAGALAFTATTEGELLEPAPSADSRPASSSADAGTVADLLLSVLTEVDRLEREGDLDRAAGRLREFLNGAPPSDLAAAALTSLAAIEKKRGKNDAARDAWHAIVQNHPEARDARGLKRSFAARLALIDAEARSGSDLATLWRDVVEDDRDPARSGTGTFKREVRRRLAPGPMLAGTKPFFDFVFDSRDRELATERQLRAAFDAGAREWIAGGGRGTRTFAVSQDTRAAADEALDEPVRVVLAVRDAAGGRLAGGAAQLDAMIAAGLERPEVRALDAIGFPVAVQGDPKGGPVPPRSLGADLGGVLLGASGADLQAFREGERTRFVLTVGLAVLGALVAGASAIVMTRAIRRESRAVTDRENFVAAVTHELKAPLASIRLLAEVLARGGVEEAKVREFAERAVGECDRLSRLVSGVLELARIEREPAFVVQMRTVDAAALARHVLDTFEPVARDHGFVLSLRVADPGLRIAGDRDALVGALVNLLDNAVKYSAAPGTIELEVAAAGRSHAAFSVLDRGRGVPVAESRRIFEPFTRLGDEMTRDRPGVGLGLALVSRIASAHGGQASCEPRAGGGSRFSVVLPLAATGTS